MSQRTLARSWRAPTLRRTALAVALGIVSSLIILGCTAPPSDPLYAAASVTTSVVPPVVVIAHAGTGRDSVSADERGRVAGADYADANVWPSRDGVLMRNHEETVDAATTCTGKVNSKTAVQLERCGLERLDKMLAWAAAHPEVGLSIEWKPKTIQAKAYAALLRSYGVAARVTTASFDASTLTAVRAQLPEGRRGICTVQLVGSHPVKLRRPARWPCRLLPC